MPLSSPRICKPSNLVSRVLKLFNFANPEDVMYRIIRNRVRYMNYGLSKENDPRPEGMDRAEENNYLELFSLAGLAVPADTLDLLEIGCGLGYGTQLINRVCKPRSIVAIDLAPHAIRFANGKWKSPNIVYRNQRFSRDAADMNSVDLIFTVESGGCFPDQEAFHAAYGILRKGGAFLVASVNPIEELRRKKGICASGGIRSGRRKGCHRAGPFVSEFRGKEQEVLCDTGPVAVHAVSPMPAFHGPAQGPDPDARQHSDQAAGEQRVLLPFLLQEDMITHTHRPRHFLSLGAMRQSLCGVLSAVCRRASFQ